MGYSFNPLVKKGFDEVGADPEDVLKIDQTTPQRIINGTPTFANGLIIKEGQKLIFDGE